jgi:hypothetical protein
MHPLESLDQQCQPVLSKHIDIKEYKENIMVDGLELDFPFEPR